jgi:pyridoxal phosphate enzyme (YggS family)
MTMTVHNEMLERNLEIVRRRIVQAAERVGRDPETIELVAVTKGRPCEAVRAAYGLGLRAFGENRVEEGRDKIDSLCDLADVKWHMIGHIQSRKAKDAIGPFALIHSVDRVRIARKLDGVAGDIGVRQAVLVECNVSGEEAKGGWRMEREDEWVSRLAEFRSLAELPNLEVRGLMTMAPWTEDRAVLKAAFERLRRLAELLRDRIPGTQWNELSMGMTDDFEVAIEQGATMIRLGRALFGEVDPNPQNLLG